MDGPDIDVEVILMTARLWKVLGLADKVTLELNSLGDAGDRARYRDALVVYLKEHVAEIDEDSRKRIERSPLRVLDSKDSGTRKVLEGAPQLADYLNDDARAHFDSLKSLLDANGIAYKVNPYLVRGLDYYGKTVFEWVTDALGAQGTVCAGGRYDGLVAQLGGKPTPAVGFAMGVERLILLIEQNRPELSAPVGVYVMPMGDVLAPTMMLAEALRDALPDHGVQLHCGGGSFKSQMKKADRSGAAVALIIGENELADGVVTVKPLRGQGEQVQVAQGDVANAVTSFLA